MSLLLLSRRSRCCCCCCCLQRRRSRFVEGESSAVSFPRNGTHQRESFARGDKKSGVVPRSKFIAAFGRLALARWLTGMETNMESTWTNVATLNDQVSLLAAARASARAKALAERQRAQAERRELEQAKQTDRDLEAHVESLTLACADLRKELERARRREAAAQQDAFKWRAQAEEAERLRRTQLASRVALHEQACSERDRLASQLQQRSLESQALVRIVGELRQRCSQLSRDRSAAVARTQQLEGERAELSEELTRMQASNARMSAVLAKFRKELDVEDRFGAATF